MGERNEQTCMNEIGTRGERMDKAQLKGRRGAGSEPVEDRDRGPRTPKAAEGRCDTSCMAPATGRPTLRVGYK